MTEVLFIGGPLHGMVKPHPGSEGSEVLAQYIPESWKQFWRVSDIDVLQELRLLTMAYRREQLRYKKGALLLIGDVWVWREITDMREAERLALGLLIGELMR